MAYQPTILNGETVFRNEVFQTGLMSQLLDGIYDGEMTIGELLSHGNFGVGTFNGLDGEMVVLDGVCYQVRHDGSVSLPDLRQQTPYAVVTNFVPMIKRELPHNLLRKSASQILDDFTVSKNYMYAIKIYGEFEWVRTRTVIKQEKPYPKMVAATENEDIVQFDNVTGTIVGFPHPDLRGRASRCPAATPTLSTMSAFRAATWSTSSCAPQRSRFAPVPACSCTCR